MGTPAVRQERRQRRERRQSHLPVAVERRGGRDRREDYKHLTTEQKAAQEAKEFCDALEAMNRIVRYPTCLDVLQVAHSLGYRRTT